MVALSSLVLVVGGVGNEPGRLEFAATMRIILACQASLSVFSLRFCRRDSIISPGQGSQTVSGILRA